MATLGATKQLGTEQALDEIVKTFETSGDYADVEGLGELLQEYKKQFMEFDEDRSGDIDIMELKRMMEKLGQAKTQLELKKMIAECDLDNSGTINFEEFLIMRLGKKSSILKIILTFEDKMKGMEMSGGSASKRDP
ncbi:allograft inflammatory factor 1-like [Lytechinus variegatus]|uniref:allograft inflammatory factor 1-like n=1 Tax=Lytechinus variegatus TaxID=7654 RepID=UPI001BB176AC|nr:allograft inflammatory factor 1-like [Lytechinus variegatus]XP_041472391.1 allograft inflammatory factor 1-like [Lytechinus variegatus]